MVTVVMDGPAWTNGWTFTACELISSLVLGVDSADMRCRWEANEMMMNVSCDALGYYGVPNPSREELDGILEAISAESKDSGLDERFLLAIMVSFSGCVCDDTSDADECVWCRCKSPRVVCEQSPHHRQEI